MIKPPQDRIDAGMYWGKSLYLVQGCTKVSKGCDNCWTEREYKRFSKNPMVVKHYPHGCNWKGRVRAIPENLEIPLTTKKPTVYSIWNDLFHDSILELTEFEWDMSFAGKVPNTSSKKRPFLFHVFHTFMRCPQHTFIVLTKREDNMRDWMKKWFKEMGFPAPENVILGVSIEDQETADKRIPALLETQAFRRVVSFEPGLSKTDISKYLACKRYEDEPVCWHNGELNCGMCGLDDDNYYIDWVIAGGESGKNARPTHPGVFCSLQEQCSEAGVKFFFKGWGEWSPTPLDKSYQRGYVNVSMKRVGKKHSGRFLNGEKYSEFPE